MGINLVYWNIEIAEVQENDELYNCVFYFYGAAD